MDDVRGGFLSANGVYILYVTRSGITFVAPNNQDMSRISNYFFRVKPVAEVVHNRVTVKLFVTENVPRQKLTLFKKKIIFRTSF